MKLQARIFRDRRASWVLIGGRPGTGKAVAEATREQGKALVAVDLAEVNHIPMVQVVTRSPDDHQAVAATLKACIETLEADLAKLEASAAVHRADFERGRERCERFMAEVLKASAEPMAAGKRRHGSLVNSRPSKRVRGGDA
jgi:NAD(P)-dependent dehydrogenase (short-subunit alcohol dehydrogenase family)